MTIEFLKPALMDDELCVETHPSAIRGASIDMTQKIRRGGEVLLAAKVRIARESQNSHCRGRQGEADSRRNFGEAQGVDGCGAARLK
jgi:hypothetical protein